MKITSFHRALPAVRRLSLAVAPALLVMAAAACSDDAVQILAPEEVMFAPELDIDLSAMTKLESGVYVQTLTPGFGSRMVELTDRIDLEYTLWLPDGTEVSTQRFTAELDGLIVGFQQGVEGMVEGEVRRLVVPPLLAYGSRPPDGSGIPPFSVLIFRVELIEIVNEA